MELARSARRFGAERFMHEIQREAAELLEQHYNAG
jgi:hypothetical protein